MKKAPSLNLPIAFAVAAYVFIERLKSKRKDAKSQRRKEFFILLPAALRLCVFAFTPELKVNSRLMDNR